MNIYQYKYEYVFTWSDHRSKVHFPCQVSTTHCHCLVLMCYCQLIAYCLCLLPKYCHCPLPVPIVIAYCCCLLPSPIVAAYCHSMPMVVAHSYLLLLLLLSNISCFPAHQRATHQPRCLLSWPIVSSANSKQ